MDLATIVRTFLLLERKRGGLDVTDGTHVRALCPNCRTATALRLSWRGWLWPRGENPPGDRDEPPFLRGHAWTCTFCQKSAVLFVHLGKESDDVNVWQVWPDNPPRQLPEVVPEEARSLYREASLAENARSLRGAAALYRAAVERICDDRGAAGKNLEDRIEDLANRGADEDLVRDLHEARLTGNWALHEGVEFSAEEVADVADLISQAVYQMYVEPAKREAMREARKRRRKERGREP